MPFHLRFHRTIKIAPGIRLNLNKMSTSVRIGGRGFGYTISSNGQRTRSFGIPGTGLSWRSTGRADSTDGSTTPPGAPPTATGGSPTPGGKPPWWRRTWVLVVAGIVGLLILIGALSPAPATPSGATTANATGTRVVATTSTPSAATPTATASAVAATPSATASATPTAVATVAAVGASAPTPAPAAPATASPVAQTTSPPTAVPSGVRIGATCSDGSHSTATGSGACSHHGGVAYWLYR